MEHNFKQVIWKKFRILENYSDFERKIFGLWAEKFGQLCENCILHIQRKTLGLETISQPWTCSLRIGNSAEEKVYILTDYIQ